MADEVFGLAFVLSNEIHCILEFIHREGAFTIEKTIRDVLRNAILVTRIWGIEEKIKRVIRPISSHERDKLPVTHILIVDTSGMKE
jgi:hypothetical protein